MPIGSRASQVIAWVDSANNRGQANVPADLTNAISLAAGDYHCLALRSDGTVAAWGSEYANGFGYAGGQTNVPSGLTNVVGIAAGSSHSLALLNDGTVTMWGRFIGTGYRFVPPEATNVVALALGPGAQHALVLRADGTAVDWKGKWGDNPYQIETNIPPTARNIVSVAAGGTHSVALRADGRVVSWGDGSGLMGVPASATNIVAISCGWSTTAAIRADGTVLRWGSSYPPQISIASIADIACSETVDVVALQRNGVLVQSSGTSYPANAANVTAVGAGSYNGLALVGSDAPTFPGFPINRTVVAGATAYFQTMAAGAFPVRYQWSCNGTNIPGATSPVLAVTNVQPEQAGSLYSLTAGNGYGTATSPAMVLNVEPLEATILPQYQTVLAGAAASFNADVVGQAPFSCQWRFGGTNLDGETGSALVLPATRLNQSGLYSCVVSNGYGAVTSSLAALSVVPLSITNQPQSQTVATGTNVTFGVAASGLAPFSYQWLYNGTNLEGETGAVLTLPNVQLRQMGAYSVVVSNSYGAVTTSAATLSVVPVLIKLPPLSQSVTVGATVTFNVTVIGLSPLSYQWLWNGTNLDGATNASVVLMNVQTNQSGTYSVVVNNAYGAVTSSGALLTVNPLSITSQPSSQTGRAGTTVTFSVTATGPTSLNYQWLWNGTNLDGANNASLMLTNLQMSQAGTYSVVVGNEFGSVSSSGAVLTVVPLTISTQPQSRFAMAGSTTTFSVAASGSSPFSYQWFCDGITLANATNSSLVLTNVRPSQNGTYSVVLSNAYGSVVSAGAALSVTAVSITSGPTNKTVVPGATVTFSVTASGSAPFYYQWLRNGTNLANATKSSLTLTNVQLSQSGTYSVIVSNSYGFMSSLDAVLSVVPLILTTQPRSQTWLAGSSVTFSVSASGQSPFNYQWRFNGTNLSDVTASTLMLTNIQMSHAGSYSVMVSNVYGAVISTNAVLTVTPLAITYQPFSQTVLAGSNVTFSVTASGQKPISYQWRFSGTNMDGATEATLTLTNTPMSAAGSYSVVVSNPFTNILSSIVKLTVKPMYLTLASQNQVAFRGGSATFRVSAQSSLPIDYQWQFNGTNLTEATTNILTLTNLQYNQAGLYTVILSNSLGTSNCAAQLAVVPVAAWGNNDYHQTNVPPALSNVLAVAGGYYHCLALQADGTVVAWGNNDYHQTNVPAGLRNVVAVAGGSYHSLALYADGTVTAWGYNDYFQTNVPAGLSNVVAVAAGGYHNLALRADGTVIAWGGNTNVPPGLSNVVAVAGGRYHSLALRADGTVVAWGSNFDGQTNVPVGLSNVISVTAGAEHSLALQTDGTVVAWGNNDFQQTNAPTGLSNVVSMAGGGQHSLAITTGGIFASWGNNNYGQTNTPAGLNNVVAVSSGFFHSLALIGDEPLPAQVLLANPVKRGDAFSLTIPSQSGRVYALEHKTSLSDDRWTALPLAAGNGGLLTLTDGSVTNSQRFYRVRRW